MTAVTAVSLATLQIHIGVAKMFIYNLIAPLVFIAVFSLPLLLLELQLLVIGISFVTPTLMLVTLIVGIISAIGARLCEEFG
jgi:hypothetical protein